MTDRMVVNAAIEKLIRREDDDGEAARIVIQFGSTLEVASTFQYERTKTTTTSGDEMSGVSSRFGDVTIKDNRTTKEEKTISLGINKDRVGHYRVWREKKNVIGFHHYWKSDITTVASDGSEPDCYYLAYNTETFEPEYFAILREIIYVKFWCVEWVELGITSLEAICGTVPFLLPRLVIRSHN